MQKIKLFFTDFDDTLCPLKQEIPKANLEMIAKLKEKGIETIVVTGRSLYSFERAKADLTDVKYYIFSTGAGIFLKSGEKYTPIKINNIAKADVLSVSKYLIAKDFNFSIQKADPKNHHALYYTASKEHDDFNRRLKLYKKYFEPLKSLRHIRGKFSQIILIIDEADLEIINKLKQKFPRLSIIRTTSPLDGKSIWVEIFASAVNKGSAAKYLANYLGVEMTNTASIGNDYNDLDLLEATELAFVTADAPKMLQDRFEQVATAEEAGFACAAKLILAEPKIND